MTTPVVTPTPKLLPEEQIPQIVFKVIKADLATQVQSSLAEFQKGLDAVMECVVLLELAVQAGLCGGR